MNPKTCAQCGKWFPGLGDLLYHMEQEHIYNSKKSSKIKQTTNQTLSQSIKAEKKDASTQTSL